ncbi:MAG: hypothetical protein ABI672_07965 [Vicinamibacteria bacterium]
MSVLSSFTLMNLLLVGVAGTKSGPDTALAHADRTLISEIVRSHQVLRDLPTSDLVDGDRDRLQGQLTDAERLLKEGHALLGLEMLASTLPGIEGMARASTGWDTTGKGGGKGIDELSKEWQEVGRTIEGGRGRFPVAKPAGQSAFVRATAEQSMGQIDEQYAVAVDYGRFSGVVAGAYYLGRAQGQLNFGLLLAPLTTPGVKTERPLPELTTSLTRLEDEIVTAYAKPGSTAQHSNFIVANSSLKLAKELNQKGWSRGALLTLLRSSFALNLAILAAPKTDQETMLSEQIEAFRKKFETSAYDDTIGLAFVEKAALAIEKSHAGGDAGDRERLRAHAIVTAVLPRYLDIMNGTKK